MRKLVLPLTLLFVTFTASASTITVDSLSDATGCSLRNAILAANTNAAVAGCTAGTGPDDDINVTVSGTYSPASALPSITEQVLIHATLGNFVLDGSSAGATTVGLTLLAPATIRGLVVQNFGSSGIRIRTTSATIAGNRIGTDAPGSTAAGNCAGINANDGGGIHVDAPANGLQVSLYLIGGSVAADRNVISGNRCHGILITSDQGAWSNIKVWGNNIGTDFCGCNPLPNQRYGVAGLMANLTTGGSTPVIGESSGFPQPCNGNCNVISSNLAGQIYVEGFAAHAQITGNVIGANAAGTVPLPNDASPTGDGVALIGSGFTNPGNRLTGNIIVRSTGAAVRVVNSTANIDTNRIGVTTNGTIIPNTDGVIVLEDGSTHGGVGLATNTIVASVNAGVILDGTHDVGVVRNSIGVVNGVVAPNQGGGLIIRSNAGSTALNNRIGGFFNAMSQGNTIAYNTSSGHGAGVVVLSGTGNKLSENSIYSNTGTLSSLQIDLAGDGPTPNDGCDSDTGPNNRQNAPVITTATRIPASTPTCPGCIGTRVFGTLEAVANTTYHVEVFTSQGSTTNPPQAQIFLGAIDVTTNASCTASWTLETTNYGYDNVVATATSPTGDTSELSAAVTVWAGQLGEQRYDSNGDGFNDILWRNYQNGGNASWLLDHTPQLIGVQNLGGIANPDYKLESSFFIPPTGVRNILWRNYVTGANAVWVIPAGSNTPSSVINLPNLNDPQFYIGGTGDFNGDGGTDILWRKNSTGENMVWLLNNGSYISTVNLPTLALPDWTIAGTGDFNLDGRMDILWHNTTNAANALWYMDGTTYKSVVNLPAISNTAFVIAAIADYDGDKKPDIVWRNSSNGQVAIWLMDGIVIKSIANIGGVSNLQIIPNGPK
ncbi:MAG TPA: VCBS repeat-containing protein [Thermoanaerobaculia bacterium]|nr:VCBS repeat-containing protein [Thermoanaerobaculia bacterium]